MLKKIKALINNERGNAGMVFVILIFTVTCINMVFGIMETSLSVATVNEVKDILENIAPNAARVGIDPEAHKNETITSAYSVQDARNYFIDEVNKGIDSMNFRSRIMSTPQQIASSLEEYTSVMPSNGRWANTWGEGGNNRKEVDYVIITTVLPLELKNNYITIDPQRIENQFNVSNINGERAPIKVEGNVSETGLAAFIRFEMKIVLK